MLVKVAVAAVLAREGAVAQPARLPPVRVASLPARVGKPVAARAAAITAEKPASRVECSRSIAPPVER
jgi:hypothetical protein